MIKAFAPAALCLLIVIGTKTYERASCRAQKITFIETTNPDPSKYEECKIASTGGKICKHRQNEKQ